MSTSIRALPDRDTNVHPTSNLVQAEKQGVTGEENKPQTMEHHRKLLEQKIAGTNGKGDTYVSPSDAIMSPASQKLAGFKQRQINKQTPLGSGKSKQPSLFAKAMTSREKDLGPVDDGAESPLGA